MKLNVKNIIFLLIGLGAGWLIASLFTKNKTTSIEESTHQHDAASDEMGTTWTCSMHPQIRQEEPGKCPICGMDLIPVSSSQKSGDLTLTMTPTAVKLANIQTTVIKTGKGQEEDDIRLSGKIEMNEKNTSVQVAHVPGRIEKLYVTFKGERVKKGQRLAEVYSPELITAQSELLEALKLKEINPDLIEASKAKLRSWKIDTGIINEIERSGEVRENFIIYADRSGVVIDRRVAVGDYVKVGYPLFELNNLNVVWAMLDAYESDLAQVAVGDLVEIEVPAIPDKDFSARITFIDPVIDPVTRTASLRAEVNNYNGQLKPQMLIKGIIRSQPSEEAGVIVPKSAVLWTGKRSVVYIKIAGVEVPTFEYREVRIGDAIGDGYHVIDGLKAGEEVVTHGSFSIDAAAQLNNQASMINKMVEVRSSGEAMAIPDYTESISSEFKIRLSSIVNEYLNLKDALVESDNSKAKAAIINIENSVESMDRPSVRGDTLLYWNEIYDQLTSVSSDLKVAGDIAQKREGFELLSETLIKAVWSFGIEGDSLYLQHCPMVNDNTGADWLSRESYVRNPYFGNKMLKCGVTKDTFINKN
ncbi:MAG: efflux RND transporter periplasmic adaptor subunit [Saprospiraceae bacterium]|nr:efflux RND transporter periplasmic adaptor subunit [Saprospiraceae bacterium]